MARNKSNDKHVFYSDQMHQLNYFSHLYGHNQNVDKFLKRLCAIGTLDKKTHLEVFKIVRDKLGYPLP